MKHSFNVAATHSRKTGHNFAGEPVYGEAKPIKVGVVHLIRTIAPTSVRTDSSASRGAAEERQAVAKLLMPVAVEPHNGDRIVILDTLLRVENVEFRFDVFGKLEHFEVSLVLWDDRENAP